MWFKNLRLYRTQALPFDQSRMQEALEKNTFQTCGALDLYRQGWVSPFGRSRQALFHHANGCTLVCARRQDKVLPSAVVNEALEAKIEQIHRDEGRDIGRKERRDLKDELIFSLLPKALTRSALHYAYIDHVHNLIVVNAASAAKAESVLDLLRESLGSLNATPLTPHTPSAHVMTAWLREGQADAPFIFGDQCELRESKEERVIRFRHQSLDADEVRQHLETGMHVSKLHLHWRDTVSFVLEDDFAMKSVKFGDRLQEELEQQAGDEADARLDTEFVLMHSELRVFTKELLDAAGGEAQTH